MLGVPTAGGPTLYLTAEDDERELHWRQAHICKALRLAMDSLVGKLHLVSIRGQQDNQLATFTYDGRLVLTPAFRSLRMTISDKRPSLVVLDNVAHLFGGNENDRVQVTAFVNALYSLCTEFGCSIVLVAHPNKAGDDYSGSTAWINAVRFHIVIRKPEDAIDPDLRELALNKANYARIGESVAFRWHDFALVRDEDLPPNMMAEIAANAAANHDNDIFLACLRARNEQRRPVSATPCPNYAVTQFEQMAESKKIGKKRLASAMDRLFRIGAIDTGFLWRDTAKGRDIHGLRENPQTLPQTVPQTLSPNAPEPEPQTPPNIYSGTTYHKDAALEAAAPSGQEAAQ